MKKNYKFVLTLIAAALIAVYSSLNYQQNNVLAYGTGAPAGKTGSPGDGSNCTACHTGTAQTSSPNVTITSTIPASGYIPGNTYTISVEAIQQGITKFGFEITTEDVSNAKVGTWINTSSETQIVNSDYVTHTSTGTSGNGVKMWSMDWIAPAAGTGDVTFYVAINATNSDGTNSGDNILLNNITVSEAGNNSVASNSMQNIVFYPNPVKNVLHISGVKSSAVARILDINGKIIMQEKSTTLDVSNLENGIYILDVTFEGQHFVKKFVKQ